MAVSPFKFLQEVREETNKVTWPSRKETMITTAMVFVMVTVACDIFPAGGSIDPRRGDVRARNCRLI